MKRIALILLNGSTMPDWDLGPVWFAVNKPVPLVELVKARLAEIQPDAWLFWDAILGVPDSKKIEAILDQPDDLWHAGLLLGTGGQPGVLDFVKPNWMFNRDPGQTAASWRVSLRACLVRDDVLRQMGFIQAEYETLDGAGLEWGLRCMQRGVFCRYERDLVESNSGFAHEMILSPGDELRIIQQRFGPRWYLWTFMRALLSGYWNISQSWKAIKSLQHVPSQPNQLIDYHREQRKDDSPVEEKISVVIPMLNRYSYLRTVLNQLRQQSMPALEIIVIDQTQHQHRQADFYAEFKDLPLQVIFQDHAGQCSSRNAGLMVSKGKYILFIDDDDEIQPDLIERHLHYLKRHLSDASCGVADEVGSSLPEAFTFQRVADVFPTNNSLLHRSALERSGLFDLAFEHGERADADLGMRLYLSGARLILNPQISVLHHHAVQGGLRVHKARVITYSSSRRNLFQRSLPSATEILLSKRYFSARQTHEFYWMSIFAGFSLHHPSVWLRLLKVVIGILLLPDTLLKLRRNIKRADELILAHPNIPRFAAEIKE
ncbi:MAG: glycosyltransferase family 2 protein [Anaerolineales bacterium]|nr:glycosyltransferase family 2 protein [Anaerolineales bacterium]